jgi:hypothetical protein
MQSALFSQELNPAETVHTKKARTSNVLAVLEKQKPYRRETISSLDAHGGGTG